MFPGLYLFFTIPTLFYIGFIILKALTGDYFSCYWFFLYDNYGSKLDWIGLKLKSEKPDYFGKLLKEFVPQLSEFRLDDATLLKFVLKISLFYFSKLNSALALLNPSGSLS